MSATVVSVPIPAEVAEFAAEQGVSAYLPAVIDMTQRIFPTCLLTLLVEDDLQIAGYRYITLRVPVTFTTAEEYCRTEWRWCGEIFQHCPATHTHYFALSVVPTP